MNMITIYKKKIAHSRLGSLISVKLYQCDLIRVVLDEIIPRQSYFLPFLGITRF